ncbi:MAG: GTPase Era [Parvibaculales bacterium]
MTTRCGFVAIIGPPNAGKSTLANALVGQKVSIVTQKAQTTRMRLRAVVMHKSTQLILVDTPGVFEPRQRLDRAMVNEVWLGMEDADHILIVLDASLPVTEETEILLARLRGTSKPVSLALNKIDLVARDTLLQKLQEINQLIDLKDSFLISADRNDGLERLADTLSEAMPEGPYLYPEDQAADIPSLLLAAEVTREKLFLRLHQELPYALTVESEKWENKKDGSIRIEQTVYVRRDGQKAIVLGKGGRTIKEIGAEARLELQAMFDCPVHLFIFVKVRKNWQEDPERYRVMGLDFKAK